jgi:hypothetical protein
LQPLETFLVMEAAFARRSTLPADRSSRLLIAASLSALVVLASLMVVLINASPSSVQLQRNFIRPVIAPPGEGYLLVEMTSNENFSSVVSMPLGGQAPVVGWPLNVTPANSSVVAAIESSIITGRHGLALAQLVSGTYVLQTVYQTLDIALPVVISTDDVTEVRIGVTEGAYPTLYSEEGSLGAQSSVYVEVPSSTQVANSSQQVVLEVQNTGARSAYEVHATVASAQQPVLGTEWLNLVTAAPFDPVNADSMLLTTWRYSALVQPPAPANLLPAGIPPQND